MWCFCIFLNVTFQLVVSGDLFYGWDHLCILSLTRADAQLLTIIRSANGFFLSHMQWIFPPVMREVPKSLSYKELLTLLMFYLFWCLYWLSLTYFYRLSGLFLLLIWDWWSPGTFHVQTRNRSVIYFFNTCKTIFLFTVSETAKRKGVK